MRAVVDAVRCWMWGHELPDYDTEHVIGFCTRCKQPVR